MKIKSRAYKMLNRQELTCVLSVHFVVIIHSSIREAWNLYLLMNIGTIYTCVLLDKLWSKWKFSRILSSLQWCLFETSTIFFIEVRRFCIYMEWGRSFILHCNFWYFKYFLLSFCLYFIYYAVIKKWAQRLSKNRTAEYLKVYPKEISGTKSSEIST